MMLHELDTAQVKQQRELNTSEAFRRADEAYGRLDEFRSHLHLCTKNTRNLLSMGADLLLLQSTFAESLGTLQTSAPGAVAAASAATPPPSPASGPASSSARASLALASPAESAHGDRLIKDLSQLFAEVTRMTQVMFEQCNALVAQPFAALDEDLKHIQSVHKEAVKMRRDYDELLRREASAKRPDAPKAVEAVEAAQRKFEAKVNEYKRTTAVALELAQLNTLEPLATYVFALLSVFKQGTLMLQDIEPRLRDLLSKDLPQRRLKLEQAITRKLPLERQSSHLLLRQNSSRIFSPQEFSRIGEERQGYLMMQRRRESGATFMKLRWVIVSGGELRWKKKWSKDQYKRVNLSLCQLREPESERLLLFEVAFPTEVFVFQASRVETMREWLATFKANIGPGPGSKGLAPSVSSAPSAAKSQLTELFALLQQRNPRCVDCRVPATGWACATAGVLLCRECAIAHQAVRPQAAVRATDLDNWEVEEIQNLFRIGNSRVNDLLEATMTAVDELPPASDDASRAAFVRAKYLSRFWIAPGHPSDKGHLSQQLYSAVIENDIVRMHRLLLLGADPSARFSSGRSLLHLLVLADSTHALAFLLEFQPNVVAHDTHGKTALHYAAERNLKRCCELLLKTAGGLASLRIKEIRGRTPLDMASEFRARGCEALLAAHMRVSMGDGNGPNVIMTQPRAVSRLAPVRRSRMSAGPRQLKPSRDAISAPASASPIPPSPLAPASRPFSDDVHARKDKERVNDDDVAAADDDAAGASSSSSTSPRPAPGAMVAAPSSILQHSDDGALAAADLGHVEIERVCHVCGYRSRQRQTCPLDGMRLRRVGDGSAATAVVDSTAGSSSPAPSAAGSSSSSSSSGTPSPSAVSKKNHLHQDSGKRRPGSGMLSALNNKLGKGDRGSASLSGSQKAQLRHQHHQHERQASISLADIAEAVPASGSDEVLLVEPDVAAAVSISGAASVAMLSYMKSRSASDQRMAESLASEATTDNRVMVGGSVVMKAPSRPTSNSVLAPRPEPHPAPHSSPLIPQLALTTSTASVPLDDNSSASPRVVPLSAAFIASAPLPSPTSFASKPLPPIPSPNSARRNAPAPAPPTDSHSPHRPASSPELPLGPADSLPSPHLSADTGSAHRRTPSGRKLSDYYAMSPALTPSMSTTTFLGPFRVAHSTDTMVSGSPSSSGVHLAGPRSGGSSAPGSSPGSRRDSMKGAQGGADASEAARGPPHESFHPLALAGYDLAPLITRLETSSDSDDWVSDAEAEPAVHGLDEAEDDGGRRLYEIDSDDDDVSVPMGFDDEGSLAPSSLSNSLLAQFYVRSSGDGNQPWLTRIDSNIVPFSPAVSQTVDIDAMSEVGLD